MPWHGSGMHLSPACRFFLSATAFLAMANQSLAATEAHPGRPDNRVRFCGFGGDGAMLDALMPWWPNLDFCRAYDSNNITGMTSLAAAARQRGVRFSLQAAAPVLAKGYLDENDCWAVDFLNRKPPQLGFGHPVADYCHPATVAAIHGNLDVAFKEVGAGSFSMVDFVWPWVGGAWGYSEACFKAYRAALAGSDGGLRLKNGSTLSFWDYFAELSGVRFQPEELGLTNWTEYEPVRSHQMAKEPTDVQRRNVVLFRGLFHYCWLRYSQDAGTHAKAQGGELQASLNPENMANGTDLLTWGRLADTGEPWLEQWGNPWTAVAGYHTYRYFTEPYRDKSKRLGLIAETGAAGGHPGDSGFGPARPHYWDPNSNYAITWAISAAGQFDDREEDYIYASPQETLDPASPQADCWRGYVKGMDGFWQYALDAPRRPLAQILTVVNRSILHDNDTSEQSVHQKYSLAPPLVDIHLDFEQAYFPLSDSMLQERKMVLFCPWEYPRDVMPRLSRWLAADQSRVLVTHSFVPSRPGKGMALGASAELDEPDAASELGLRDLKTTGIKAGKITFVEPAWADNFALQVGTELKLNRNLIACAGTALVKLGDTALVTRIETPGKGSIIYLNFTPPERYEKDAEDAAKLLKAVLECLARQSGIQPQAEGSSSWACSKYDLASGSAYFLIDKKRLKQERFTEETGSMDPASKLYLKVKPKTNFKIYDVLGETLAQRGSDEKGRLEIFLSGRAVRLLYLVPETLKPSIIFMTCERRDGKTRIELPARIAAHRAGRAVLTGIPKAAAIMVDGHPVQAMETSIEDGWTIPLSRGDHSIEVR